MVQGDCEEWMERRLVVWGTVRGDGMVAGGLGDCEEGTEWRLVVRGTIVDDVVFLF